MIDPYPGVAGAKDRGVLHPKIEEAHRGRNFHRLIDYWSGDRQTVSYANRGWLAQ